MTSMSTMARAIVLACVAAATSSAARAECYDILGCSDRSRFAAHSDYLESRADGPTCDFLWQMRNRIYKEHGYCFATARGRSELGNEGCSIGDVSAVPLSGVERANVVAIQRAERVKRCSP